MKAAIIALATLLTWMLTPARAQPTDALDEALKLVGMRRTDLGWTPKGWWPRWPDAPYKLRAFDSLFAQPLDAISFTRALAQTAWERLDPAELNNEQERGSRNLFQAVQRLGIDPKFGGFRGYTANVLAPQVPLDQAVVELYRVACRTTRPSTFGMELLYPRIEEELDQKVKALPEGVSPILGELVLNIIDAHRWVELAFRNVDARARQVVATRLEVGTEMIDAYDYCPEIDDVARTWDEASLWYAAQKCVDALDLARIRLQQWRAARSEPVPYFMFDWETPWGWIRIRGAPPPAGMQPEAHPTAPAEAIHALDAANALLVVDLGDDDDHYRGGAASTATCPLSLLLDLGGNDSYRSDLHPAFGAGLTGIGILIDPAGDDHYHAERYAQGIGQFGLGLLADLSGNDRYFVGYSGQGCGYFGVGLLLDAAGDDEYQIYADGQGLGGVAGVGILADRTGDDRYVAERKHSVTGRPSYHSPGIDVGVSNVQGCGLGRRGDGSDGHCWAGGLGALLDGAGNDYYSAGNWSMGTGYWFGIGVLHDREGDDEYHGVAYSQGTGAHFCIGVHIDEAGDDQHLSEENSHIALAWAHDFTVGILLDAAGNDLYSVDHSGLAYSLNRSVAMLIDTAGNDVYKTKRIPRPGLAQNDEKFRARDGVSTYFADTTSIALFLDIGGNDTYWGDIRNNTHWLDPPESPNWADRNFSVGVDRAEGAIDFRPIPVRLPSAAATPPKRD